MDLNYDFYKKSADYIKERTEGFTPEIGLILGSGLGGTVDRIEDKVFIPYSEIPNFLVSTAPGHAGELVFGTLEGRKVVCMSGRFHYYEGYEFEQLTIPVRVMKLLGINKLIVTNAAGAINTSYKVGDIMIMKDHIFFSGHSPLRGINDPEFGERFFDITRVYDPEFRRIALECAKDSPLDVHEGVYFYFQGPQFESPAEIRAARILGGDCAGMSTVTEVLTAAHCGLPVLGISLMTNMGAGILDKPLSGEEVNEVGRKTAPLFQEYFLHVVRELPK